MIKITSAVLKAFGKDNTKMDNGSIGKYWNGYLRTSIMEWSLLPVVSASSRTPLYLYEILHYLDVAAPDNVCLGRGGGGEVGGDR